MNVIKRLKEYLMGSLKTAKINGLNVGTNVSVIGRVDFGSEPYLITLGNNVRISFDVVFITHDGGTWAFRDIDKFHDIIKYGKIFVGDNTFIGCRSIIMPGVNIGSRCVIGAGSIVTKDIPNGMVACGNPAKIIMTTDDYAAKCLKNMKSYNKEEYKKNKNEYLKKWL